MSGIWRGKRKYYQAWWTNVEGEREQGSTGRTTKKAAVAWLRGKELEASVRGLPAFTVGRALELAGKKQVRRGNVKRTLSAAMSRAAHIARLWGDDTDLHGPGDRESINALLVEVGGEYMDTRRTEMTPQGRPVSESQIRKELQLLAQGLRVAARGGKFTGEPNCVFPEELGGDRIRTRCPASAELRKLRGRATPWRWRWIALYANTGADVSELHRVRRKEDVDFTEERGPFGAIHLRGTKTAHRDRWVPMTPETHAFVDELLEISDEDRHPSRIGYLMPALWDSSSFAKTVRPWCDELGIERIIVKDLRRYYVSTLRENGVAEADCVQLMGHVNSAMIRRIYHQGDNAAFDQVARTLPNLSANMRHDNVVPIGKASELGELDSDAVEGNT
jgi:integrase